MAGNGTKSTDKEFEPDGEETLSSEGRLEGWDAHMCTFVSLAGENSWISSLEASVFSVT